MGLTLVGEKKYTIDTTVRAFEYFALSRSTYSRLREDFELPCIATLTSLTSKIRSADDPSFITNVFAKLPVEQKTCFIIIDEVCKANASITEVFYSVKQLIDQKRLQIQS